MLPLEATSSIMRKEPAVVVQTDSGMGAGMVLGIVLAVVVLLLVIVLALGGFGDDDGGTTVVPDVAPGTATGGDTAPKNQSPTNMRIHYVTPATT